MMKIKQGNKILLGLSHANLDRLRADGLKGAIKVAGKDLGIDVDIYITAAETEAVMLQEFAAGIGPDTEVKIDKRLKS
jgi:hypothetical protein